jgi:hypothetical protein
MQKKKRKWIFFGVARFLLVKLTKREEKYPNTTKDIRRRIMKYAKWT